MASAAELARGITIKTKMLQRLHKEYNYYQAEAEKEHSRVEAMKSAGADTHDLRQAVRASAAGVPRGGGLACCAVLRAAVCGGGHVQASNPHHALTTCLHCTSTFTTGKRAVRVCDDGARHAAAAGDGAVGAAGVRGERATGGWLGWVV
jgi:hypothetical protein